MKAETGANVRVLSEPILGSGRRLAENAGGREGEEKATGANSEIIQILLDIYTNLTDSGFEIHLIKRS